MIVGPGRRIPRPGILAVLNASPESFSGNVVAATEAAALAARLVDEGADVIDVGAQSLRTDQPELPVQDEIDRLLPVLRAVRLRLPEVAISVDTYRHQVALAAFDHGVSIVNDPSGLHDPEMADVVAATDVSIVVAHNPGPPKIRRSRSDRPDDPVGACLDHLSARIETLRGAGIPMDRIIVDPGPDLYKPPDHTIAVLRAMDAIRAELEIERVLWALSRKDFIGALLHALPRERAAGTLGAMAALPIRDRDLVRVHDVRATVDFLTVQRALSAGIDGPLELADELRYDRPSTGR